MIWKVGKNNTQNFLTACSYERVFGSKCRTALASYGETSSEAGFWVADDNEGNPVAALFERDEVLVVSSNGRLSIQEMASFVKEHEIKEVDCSWEECAALQTILGGRTESSFYMAYQGGPLQLTEGLLIDGTNRLQEVFSVLQQSHEYYTTHLKFQPWSQDLMLKLNKGLCEVFLLEHDGKAIGTGSVISEDEAVGAIGAVAVIPAYRGKGFGSFITKYLVNHILEKGKQPVLISGYDEVAKLYRKVGFKETGRWGELYL